ncbi:MAG: hypothetical protein WC539_09485 [Nitrospirota bacterium]
MIRFLFILLILVLAYYVMKAIVHAMLSSSKKEQQGRLPGDEMVRDPECSTYIVKNRAVKRFIKGSPVYFCSEACAKQYEKKHGA